MDRNHVGIAAGHYVAKAGPDVLALTRFRRIKVQFLKAFADGKLVRAVVPDHHVFLWQAREKLHRLAIFVPVGAVEPHDNSVQVRYLGQFVDNAA